MGNVCGFLSFEMCNPESHIRSCCCGRQLVSGGPNGKPRKRGIFTKVQSVTSLSVEEVLQMIQGRWYGVARIPNWYEDGLYVSSAIHKDNACEYYDVVDFTHDEDIHMTSIQETLCRWSAPTIPVSTICGRLYGPGPLEFSVVYDTTCMPSSDLVIYYGYREAAGALDQMIIGDPTGARAWILSRTPQLDSHEWDRLIRETNMTGLNFERFIRPTTAHLPVDDDAELLEW